MPNDSNRPDVAVFIDFENVYVSVRDKLDANPNFESIMDRCEDFGRVVIARAYADWYRYPRITSALYANGIEPMYVPTYYYDREMGRTGRAIKNSVDMNLCVDAMKTLFTNPNIAKFVLATGDRDFIPLVNTIRQQGKEVIVIGIGGAASAHLAQSADEFIFYEQLIGKRPTNGLHQDQPRARMPEKGREHEPDTEEVTVAAAPTQQPASRPNREPQPTPPEREREPAQPDVYDILVNAIHLARERGYVCSFGSLKLLMKELMGGEFKEGKYKDSGGKPFAKFKDFVLEGERRGKVQVFTNGTVNEVFLPGEDPYKLSQFAQELKEEPAALLPVPEPAEDREARGAAVSNGRRRRRRPRDRQRQAPQLHEVTLPPEDEEYEPLGEEPQFTAPDTVLAPDFPDAEQADAVFNSLLEQIEQEDAALNDLVTAQRLDPLPELSEFELTDVDSDEREPEAEPQLAEAALVETAPEPVVDLPVEELPVEELPVAELPAPTPEPAIPAQSETDLADLNLAEVFPTASDRPFDEGEWQTLRSVVGAFERPVSFAQIHDALRDARNRTLIGRTNEELRTLIKQGINNGVLTRIGKGNRISYRLAQPLEETPALVAPVDAETAAPELVGEPASEGETPDQATLIEQAAPPVEVEQPAPEQAEEPATVAPEGETPDQATLIEQAAPLVEVEQPAPEAEQAVPAEKPARRPRTRRRKADAEQPAAPEQAAPAAETPAPAEEAPAPKRRRTRRKASSEGEAQES
ncbi:MAG TPA: NYN domain-containing protein [Roseiflexaceae bacterium]|nr:NYN domain-containing protein [Roseiflexaceae bacterium]